MKKRSSLFKTVLFLGVFLLAAHYLWLLKGQYLRPTSLTQSTQKKGRYYCSMHPSITSDHPAKCPICAMSLQKEDDHTGHASAKASSERKILFYKHPMGKNVTSPVPMKDEMGMDFIPVYENELTEDEQGKTLDGRTTFLLSEANQQLIGVTKSKVTKKEVVHEIKASGRVAFDPDLYSAISEYRVARETAHLTRNAQVPSLHDDTNALIASSKLKLQLMGLTPSQIAALESNKLDPKDFLLPKGNVWVYADIFEYELPQLKLGQTVLAESPLYRDKAFEGKISSISPVLNTSTRTVTIKAEVSDSEQLLKSEMFLTVRIQINLGEQLTLPDDAVIHTGDRDLVFVVDADGRFEPREVKTGVRSRGDYVVLAGLHENETVVTGANFLIDSESRLRAVVQGATHQHATGHKHATGQ